MDDLTILVAGHFIALEVDQRTHQQSRHVGTLFFVDHGGLTTSDHIGPLFWQSELRDEVWISSIQITETWLTFQVTLTLIRWRVANIFASLVEKVSLPLLVSEDILDDDLNANSTGTQSWWSSWTKGLYSLMLMKMMKMMALPRWSMILRTRDPVLQWFPTI